MLGSEVCVYTLDQAVGVCGVEDDEKKHVILSSEDSVTLFDVDSSKPTYSWSVVRGHKLYSKAIYSSTTDKYYGILDDGKVLVQWSKGENRIGNEDHCTKLSSPATTLIHTYAQPLIFYRNGDVSSTKEPDKYIWKHASEFEICENVACFHLYNGKSSRTHVAFVVKESQVYLYYHLIINGDENVVEEHYRCVLNVEGDAKPLAMRLSDSGAVIAWSDGRITLGNTLDNRINWSPSVHLSKSGFEQPLNLLLLRDEVVLFYANSEKRFVCTCFSRKYTVETSRRYLNHLSDFSVIDLQVVGSGVLCLVGSSLLLFPFGETKSLATMIGTRRRAATGINKPFEGKLQWTRKGLVKVGEENYQPQSLEKEEIIKELCMNGEFERASAILRELNTVRESFLVDILRRYLPANGFEEIAKARKSQGTDNIIDQVIALKTDVIFIAESMGRLSVAQAVYLLAYLHQALRRALLDPEYPAQPSLIVDWVTAIIDAHFNGLVNVNQPQILDLVKDLVSFIGERCKNGQAEMEMIRDIQLTEQMMKPGNSWNRLGSLPEYEIHVLIF